jgi:hypothetical protein
MWNIGPVTQAFTAVAVMQLKEAASSTLATITTCARPACRVAAHHDPATHAAQLRHC